jgi:hypothetical protein
MRKKRPSVYVLDCDFIHWFYRMRGYVRWQGENQSADLPSILPFTFNDVHPTLAVADRNVVLRPSGGVKS